MTWFLVDDGFYDHPKVKSIPRGTVRKGAVFLWNQAGSWSCRYPNDGLVPPHMVEELGASKKDADWLIAADLWHTAGHDCTECPPVPAKHYLFHDWLKHQKSKEQIEAEKKAARERMARLRRGGKPAPEHGATVLDINGRSSGEQTAER